MEESVSQIPVYLRYPHAIQNKAFEVISIFQKKGYRVWFDSDISAGDLYNQVVAEHIENCEVFCCLLPQEYAISDFCIKEGSKALVISRYGLDLQPYDTKFGNNVTWETCTLRQWLNKTFYTRAFSSKERQKILTTIVKAEDNPKYGTEAGMDTEDKVFLLSINEAKEYLDTSSKRKCAVAPYVESISKYDFDRSSFLWLLRSPGYRNSDVVFINDYGSVTYFGTYVSYDFYATRPAMWINLGS